MNDTGVKQQIVEGIKSADTILVTVGQHPTVDELSAALGLTLFLNDIGKHATAVVSGDIPPAITFLKPEKTFENSVDSLRDFVIALDKEKADHLRYKVEGDVVKIFITPYRTVISKRDLEYSQGDYNVEMVIAVGVRDKEHLDKALASHGRILHDASVATIGLTASTLGTMDWSDGEASSLSELATGLVDSLSESDKPVAERVASALLTGVVAATDRFSNEKTTANAMTISAKLMALGANQQLIAAKLREGSKLDFADGNGTAKIDRNKQQAQQSNKQPEKKKDSKESLSISHHRTDNDEGDSQKKRDNDSKNNEPKEAPREVSKEQPRPKQSQQQTPAPQKQPAPEDGPKKPTNDAPSLPPVAPVAPPTPAPIPTPPLEPSTPPPMPTPAPQTPAPENEGDALAKLNQLVDAPGESANDAAQLAAELAQGSDEMPKVTPPVGPEVSGVRQSNDGSSEQGGPVFGGTLNATTQQAADDKRRNAGEDKNKAILSHGSGKYIGDSQPTFQSPLNGTGVEEGQTVVNPLAGPSAPTVQAAPIGMPTLPPLPPQSTPDTPPPPPTPDFSQLPPMPPQMPDFGPMPPAPNAANLAPEEPLGQMLPPSPVQTPAPAPSDPGQFKIPGQ